MASLWPDSFDANGNKTDWRYDPALREYYSPSTQDFIYATDGNPPVEDQIAWVEQHKDAILLKYDPISREPAPESR